MSFTPPVGAATTTSRGIVKLAGDLSGTADSPTVPSMARANLGGQETISTNSSATGSIQLNPTNGNVFSLTLTGNITPSVVTTGLTAGKAASFALYLKQDATGGRTVTWTSMNIKWAGGAPPTLSTSANALDIVVFETLDTGSTWYGSLVGTSFA